ncbi:MAG TPA: tyrosine--tRNA ligase [Patescibacteria group bacterium]|nr:tyrosine--tRNA ligase [Patescibacteria group bacterium]
MNIDEVLTRGVTNIIPNKQKLEELLKSDKKLNIYFGADPTATHLHIGNAVGLRKLQQFVELGHNVKFLIGDFTALIGDTSDKDTERPVLTYEQIQQNFKDYKRQAEKILDFSKVNVVFNSEWLKKLSFEDIIKLCQHFSFGEFASRELVAKRLKEGKKVGLHEALYPVMQGYDSWHLNTDIQLGGADQTFNMQAGRILQRDLREKESFILVTGYLEGTDGRKMSKSWGNAIWIDDNPYEMYGKVMSVRDDLIVTYLTLATNLADEKIEEKKKRLADNENPSVIKKELAFQIVKELHSEKDAKEAQEKFEKTFQKKEPDYGTPLPNQGTVIQTIAPFTSLSSMSEAKRMINAGAIEINGEVVNNGNYETKIGDKIKIGKKVFGTVVDKI